MASYGAFWSLARLFLRKNVGTTALAVVPTNWFRQSAQIPFNEFVGDAFGAFDDFVPIRGQLIDLFILWTSLRIYVVAPRYHISLSRYFLAFNGKHEICKSLSRLGIIR